MHLDQSNAALLSRKHEVLLPGEAGDRNLGPRSEEFSPGVFLFASRQVLRSPPGFLREVTRTGAFPRVANASGCYYSELSEPLKAWGSCEVGQDPNRFQNSPPQNGIPLVLTTAM